MAYQHLFQSGKIGSLCLKNRTVMPAMGVSLAEPDGRANEPIIRYYEERAKGGVGLIITEITRIEPIYGTAVPNQLGAYEAFQVPHLQRLAERVHKYGTKIFLQLQHPGRENKSSMIGGRQIVAPSAVMCKVTNEMPRELTTQECQDIMKAFVKGAVLAKTAGFDGVELHAAHGYLLGEFLSPYTNKRCDRYGGSLANRTRILEEIITAIRHLCGPRFAISVRISADEFVEGGLRLEESVKIARILESVGANAINVSAGIYETSTTIIEPASYPQGWKKHLASAIRQNVSIPVIAVNNIKEPDVAEGLLAEGVCDFVALGRQLLADPEWPNKAQSGHSDEINRCIGCLFCFSSLSNGNHILCAVNPRCGREVEYSDLKENGEGKIVAVVGGGPAGMEAALTLKARGFSPILLEKADRLGGQLNIADQPILKDKLAAYKNALIHRVKKADIEVHLHTEATVQKVQALQPVGVFLASGATPLIPPIPGVEGSHVMTAEEVLGGKRIPLGKVAVIGGGMTGMETAETLRSKGHEVSLIEMQSEIGNGLYRSVLADFMIRTQKMGGIEIRTREKLLSVGEGKITLLNTQTSQISEPAADSVVLALGTKPNVQLTEEFEAAFDHVIVLGDANYPARIVEAVFDGFSRATTFEGRKSSERV